MHKSFFLQLCWSGQLSLCRLWFFVFGLVCVCVLQQQSVFCSSFKDEEFWPACNSVLIDLAKPERRWTKNLIARRRMCVVVVPRNFVWGSCFWFCIPGSFSSRRLPHTYNNNNFTPTNLTYNNLTYNNFTHTHTNLTYNNFTHTNLTYNNLTYNNFTHTQT